MARKKRPTRAPRPEGARPVTDLTTHRRRVVRPPGLPPAMLESVRLPNADAGPFWDDTAASWDSTAANPYPAHAGTLAA